MNVLLLVDIQNDFCPGGSLAVTDGDQVVSVANELMRSGNFDLVVASQDWHPANHLSFASNHAGHRQFDQVEIQGVKQILWPDHAVANTPGAEFHRNLDQARIDIVQRKGSDPQVDSYSAFYDVQGKPATQLEQLLDNVAAQHGKKRPDVHIAIAGLALDYCVAETARDAARLGHQVSIVLDGTRAVDQSVEGQVRLLREFARQGIKVVASNSLFPGRNYARNQAAASRDVAVSV